MTRPAGRLLRERPRGGHQRRRGRYDEAHDGALRRVGLRDLADRNLATLSGGEKQRTLIARALAQQADHLLLDEPTNHLDIHYQHEVLELVRNLDVATVLVLHDLNLAARYCDHLVLLDKGHLACAGATAEVLTPDVLEPVYRVTVRVLHDEDAPQLIFRPHASIPAATSEPTGQHPSPSR